MEIDFILKAVKIVVMLVIVVMEVLSGNNDETLKP